MSCLLNRISPEHRLAGSPRRCPIDRFVFALGERIDAIQDAELAACTQELAELARCLSTDAERVGYPGLAQSAKSVAMAAEDGKTETMQEAIFELTDLGQRIRRGHRGAA